MTIIYSMYRVGEVSLHPICCEWANQPYLLGGGGTIYPSSRPAGVTTYSPRMVTGCLLISSMLNKMYLPFHVYVHCIYSQSIHAVTHSVYFNSLSNCVTVFVSHNNSIRIFRILQYKILLWLPFDSFFLNVPNCDIHDTSFSCIHLFTFDLFLF